MEDSNKIKKIVEQGLEILRKNPNVIEGQVFAADNCRTVSRLVYTSRLPCNGLEELKSDQGSGISVEAWFKSGDKKLVGFGHEAGSFSLEALKSALRKASRDAVEDKDFHGFLRLSEISGEKKKKKPAYCDEKLINLSSKEEASLLAGLGWEAIRGATAALRPYARRQRVSPQSLAFILNGDVFFIREKMALASTNNIIVSEESTILLSFLTVMLEKENAKGSGWGSSLFLKDFSPYRTGKMATMAAINQVGGVRAPAGRYKVVFGPQAVAEIFGSLLSNHLKLSLIDFGASIFCGKFGQKVASDLLTLEDDPTMAKAAGSKQVSCEGWPTSRTKLIDKGVFAGCLSDSRLTNKVFARAKEETPKLGVNPQEIKSALLPKNGFRFGLGGGRDAASSAAANATNLVIKSHQSLAPKQILRKVKDGIFIGRLWYTYPVGGWSSGIISGTAVADNFLIKNGKLAEPILLNSLRLEDNLAEMIQNIVAVGSNPLPTILWASDEITVAPWVAVDGVNFVSIGKPGPP